MLREGSRLLPLRLSKRREAGRKRGPVEKGNVCVKGVRGRKRKTTEGKLKGRKKERREKGNDREQMKTHLCIPGESTERGRDPRGEKRVTEGKRQPSRATVHKGLLAFFTIFQVK